MYGITVSLYHNYITMAMAKSILPVIPNATKLAIPRHFAVYPNNQEIRHITEIPNNAIEIRDAINGSYITMLSACGHTLPLRLISFSNDGKKIITGAHDASVKISDAAHGTLLMKLEGHEHGADYAAFNCDDTMILTISNDYKARVWDASNGACKTVLRDQKILILLHMHNLIPEVPRLPHTIDLMTPLKIGMLIQVLAILRSIAKHHLRRIYGI